MNKWILTVAVVLSSVASLAQAAPSAPSRPPRYEANDTVRAVGFDRRDCQYRLQSEAARREGDLLRSCQNQSGVRCQIVARNFMGGGYIYPIAGNYKVDDYKIDANTCRVRAASYAEREAVENCQKEYGVRCQITRRGYADHREERRRRYVIAGPKENFQVCRGNAEAAPDSRYREQCSMRITASNY